MSREMKCVICGNVFITSHSTQKICSFVCRKKNQRIEIEFLNIK